MNRTTAISTHQVKEFVLDHFVLVQFSHCETSIDQQYSIVTEGRTIFMLEKQYEMHWINWHYYRSEKTCR